MQKFLVLILCLFLVSTLVISVSCKKKEEAPPEPTMEVAPAEEAPTEPTTESEPAEEVPPALGTFRLKALSAEVNFIKEKKVEAQQELEAINQIKDQIQNLLTDSQQIQKEIEKSRERILKFEKELSETARLAKPPFLSFFAKEITKTDSGYKVLLWFKSSKNQPLGVITFVAKVVGDSKTRILDFWPTCGTFLTGPDSKTISENGEMAKLSYQLVGVCSPAVKLMVSEPTRVSIQGSHELKPFDLLIE